MSLAPPDHRPLTADVQSRLGGAVVLAVLLLQFVSRYLPAPAAVFVGDDWSNYARSSFYASHAEAARTGLQDPHRPLSMAAVELAYRLFGPRPLYWTVLSLVANSLMLWFVMRMGLELTGSRRVAALQGVVFALLPNLTETWHWSTQIVNEVTCALLFYALSGWLFAAHARRGGGARLAGAALAYGIGLFSYEQGLFLPAAFAILLPWRREPVRSAARLAPFGVVFILYMAWRMTDAFGLNASWHYPPHMQAGDSASYVLWNLKQVIHWWAGDNLAGAVRAGADCFAELAPWTRRALLLLDLAVVLAGGAWLARRAASGAEPAPRAAGRPLAFALAWAGAALAVCVLSYTGGRLNVLPAMGLSLALALGLSRLAAERWRVAWAGLALLALAANQGTAESFRQSGLFQQRLFQHLRDTRSAWEDKEVLLLDTRALRQRLTPGLLAPVGTDPATWAEYRNALLVRGFAPRGMVQLILGRRDPALHVVLDVECGARVEGDSLHWHERYLPERPRTTPWPRVHAVDIFEAAARAATSP